MIKLIHAADLHLDSAFEALPDDLARLRRSEQRELLARITDLTESEGAQLILLAGDLLDSGSSYYETAQTLAQAFEGCKTRVFISPGNHDPYTRSGPYGRISFPENVHVFKNEGIECVELPELGARVWGAGFTQSGASGLLRGFEAEKSEGFTDIMVIHGDPVNLGSPYNAISAGDIAKSGMDYIALGHLHTFSGLLRSGEAFYAWPGCPEGRGFDETGEKGVIAAELGQGTCSLRLVPVCSRKYEIVSVSLTGAPDHADAILSALPGDTSRDIYRILLTGECEAAPDLTALGRSLDGHFFSFQLKDRTRPARDIWENCGEDTLRGLFLSRLKRRFDEAEDEAAREHIVRAVRFGLAAIDGMEEPYTFS